MVDGVARIHLFPLYSGSAWLSKFYHDWLRFFFPPNTQDQNHLDISGIEPGSPAQQASTLSITPSPLRWVLEKNTAMVSHWVNGVWMSRPGLEPRTRNSPLYSMHYWLRYHWAKWSSFAFLQQQKRIFTLSEVICGKPKLLKNEINGEKCWRLEKSPKLRKNWMESLLMVQHSFLLVWLLYCKITMGID